MWVEAVLPNARTYRDEQDNYLPVTLPVLLPSPDRPPIIKILDDDEPFVCAFAHINDRETRIYSSGPISSSLILAMVTGFFYYTFMYVFKREVPLKKIATLVILATLPRKPAVII